MWRPNLPSSAHPKYIAIAEAIGSAIANGELAPGDRLPTHRDLARGLGVTIGTVTRSYAEAARRGLIEATVGRGTFVRTPREPEPIGCLPIDAPAGAIELGLNCPAPIAAATELERAFAHLGTTTSLGELLRYGEMAGRESHRATFAERLSHRLPTTAEQLIVTGGCQQAILMAIAATCQPGDVLLAEELTYAGARAAARLLGVRIEPVRIDRHGVEPDDFARACAQHRPTAFYCVPTLQSPTATLMPTARRKQIARIADEHGVPILEDDVHGFLVPNAPAPLVSWSSGPSFFMSSISKSVAGGLRVGYLRTSQPTDDRVLSGLWASTLNGPGPLAEVACELIRTGAIDRIEAARRTTAQARNRLARERLGDFVAAGSSPHSQFVWLEFENADVEAIVTRAARAGVHVMATANFAANGSATSRRGIRVCLAREPDEGRLADGLARLEAAIHGDVRTRMPGL